MHRNGVRETDIDAGYLEVALTKHGKDGNLSVQGNVRTFARGACLRVYAYLT